MDTGKKEKSHVQYTKFNMYLLNKQRVQVICVLIYIY